MKARPILFNGDMVHALLDGSKTQTRRQINLKDFNESEVTKIELEDDGWWFYADNKDLKKRWCTNDIQCKYGQVGDLLYVRETLREDIFGSESIVTYKLDDTIARMGGISRAWKWQRKTLSSIHMPRWASRLTLKITDIRVERVQDIEEKDALAEGVKPDDDPRWNPVQAYEHLWSSINGNWNDNPWVWCISFEVIKQNVDEVMA